MSHRVPAAAIAAAVGRRPPPRRTRRSRRAGRQFRGERESRPACACTTTPAPRTVARIRSVAEAGGARLTEQFGHILWSVTGINHARKDRTVAEALRRLPGVMEAEVHPRAGARRARPHDSREHRLREVLDRHRVGFPASDDEHDDHDHGPGSHDHGGSSFVGELWPCGKLAGWLPGRDFVLCGDGAYASLAGAGLARTHIVSRMRRDAALLRSPAGPHRAPGPAGQEGAPPTHPSHPWR